MDPTYDLADACVCVNICSKMQVLDREREVAMLQQQGAVGPRCSPKRCRHGVGADRRLRRQLFSAPVLKVNREVLTLVHVVLRMHISRTWSAALQL